MSSDFLRYPLENTHILSFSQERRRQSVRAGAARCRCSGPRPAIHDATRRLRQELRECEQNFRESDTRQLLAETDWLLATATSKALAI